MEIKDRLNRPYTEVERMQFIVSNNHQKGYEIRNTEYGMEAWGYTDEEIADMEAQAKKDARIEELHKLLSDTDYCIIKIAEGAATREDYADVIALREGYREELRILEP